MCHTNNGEVSVVSDVILGEGRYRHTRRNEFLPTRVRYHGESGVRSSRGVEAALDEGLCRERVSDAEIFSSAGQSDLCSGEGNAEALSIINLVQWTQTQYQGSLGH